MEIPKNEVEKFSKEFSKIIKMQGKKYYKAVLKANIRFSDLLTEEEKKEVQAVLKEEFDLTVDKEKKEVDK